MRRSLATLRTRGWTVNTCIHTYRAPGRALQKHTFGHKPRERSAPWPRAATRDTPMCELQRADMICRWGRLQQPRGRHTRPLRRPAKTHREGGPQEAHGRGTIIAERATPPSDSDRTPTPHTPHHPPNARNPGLAAFAEEQRRQEPGCTHGAKEGAADLQGARSRGARSQIHGRRARKASSISHTRVRCTNRHGKRPRIARALLCDVRVAHRVDLGVAMHPSTTQPGAH
jgi:hypothetical protein